MPIYLDPGEEIKEVFIRRWSDCSVDADGVDNRTDYANDLGSFLESMRFFKWGLTIKESLRMNRLLFDGMEETEKAYWQEQVCLKKGSGFFTQKSLLTTTWTDLHQHIYFSSKFLNEFWRSTSKFSASDEGFADISKMAA